MIKDKGPDNNVKEEAGTSETTPTDAPFSENSAKKEDEPSCSVKKESNPSRNVTKNGATSVIGSTNTGTLSERKLEHEDANSVPSDASNLRLKTEESCSAENEMPLEVYGGLGPPHPPPDGVQPLASNVINKQTSSMEVQYMQQQSQIFVFSTLLANKGAEEVLQGRFPSIIAYHCAQPGTKKYLEKNPLKVTQFINRQPAQWLNMAVMKNKLCPRNPGLMNKGGSSMDGFLGPEGLDDMVGLSDTDLPWDQKNNQLENLDGVSNGGPMLPDIGQEMEPCGNASPSMGNVQPTSLQGVKVPDENLTPQQRQHREEQLATIRKMHQMLFPEHQSIEGSEGVELPPEGIIPQNRQGQLGGISAMPPVSGGPSMNMHAPPTSVAAQMEWQKLQHQFYEERKKPDGRGAPPMPRTGPGQGIRLQGPPPPYHQTPRSASVPIALQSPNPASPNNPTSNLSLPSPRTSSALNSPADPNRPFGITRHLSTGHSPTSQDSPSTGRLNASNPSTPISSHLSPNISGNATDSTSNHQSADGMFGRTLQSMAQQKQQQPQQQQSQPQPQPQQQQQQQQMGSSSSNPNAPKEPNLMPVPSPQQIQYLNTFEGQELTIQKQPNTSLKESDISPSMLATTIDGGFSGPTDMPMRVSGPNTPITPTSIDMGPRFPSTPGVPTEVCRFHQIPSPQTPSTVNPPASSAGDKGPRFGGSAPPPRLSPSSSEPIKNEMYLSNSPHPLDPHNSHKFTGTSEQSPNHPGSKMNFMNVSPSGKDLPVSNYGCVRADNLPLNPNSTSVMTNNPKVSHFDPISSLAQMSQQLTNSVASSLNGQSTGGGNMMNFGSSSMHMMEMGGCHGMPEIDNGPNMIGMSMQGSPHPHGFHPNSPMGPIRSLSPKLPGPFPNHVPMPRMMGRSPGPNPYNGANVQVKPSAPNTIQYLPAKPQVGTGNPRGPPSLDFLHRFTNPMPNMDNKMPSQNLQYFPHCGPNQGPGPNGPGGMPSHMIEPGMPNEGPMGPIMGGPMVNGPMGGNMGMPGGMIPMMRGPAMRPGPPGMIRMQPMGFNGPSNGGPDGMFHGGPSMPNPNTQMFVSGPKGSPMGMGAPDATQPLPPSMGQSNTFKNSPFVGPTTADPNYAQQFHNFQQQLYATTTRSQMGPGPGPPHSVAQPSYFTPK